MQDINLTGPLMDAIIASVTTGTTATLTVADIDATIAQLDQHGGTQSLTVTGNIVAGVFLGSSFSLQLITTNESNNMKSSYVILNEMSGQLVHSWRRISGGRNFEVRNTPEVSQAETFTRANARTVAKYFNSVCAGGFCVLTAKQARELFAAENH